MLGAAQVGVMAACVVLFVPMAMAGWHLSRNKMLFFSGALFITLAVGVHLTPYFPSFSNFLTSPPSSSSSSRPPLAPLMEDADTRQSCIAFLHDIVFDVRVNASLGYDKSWDWAKTESVTACNFQKLGVFDASVLLNGSWVVVAGDSQARLFALELLNLVMDSSEMEAVRGHLFKRHSDYQIALPKIGAKLDFVWAPYVENLTDLMVGYRRAKSYPDVLAMGSGLWHMLHVTNATHYGAALQSLKRASQLSLVATRVGTDGPIRLPQLFWFGMPMLINTMLNTEEKRVKMSSSMQDSYNAALRGSGLLVGSSDGPFLLLDIHSLSHRCGSLCTVDGMHYHGTVYEASVQIMLNALLIESDQLV